MAELPTHEQLIHELLSIFSYFHNGRPKPNDGLSWQNIQSRWHDAGFRADDFNNLISTLTDQGFIVMNKGYYSFTDQAVEEGIINIPTDEEIERAILDVFKERSVRSGEGEMSDAIQMDLWNKGFTGEQCVAGFKSIIDKGLLERGDNATLILTPDGFSKM